MRPDDRFLGRRTTCHIDDEPCGETAQIEAPVEAISEGVEVVARVLAVLQRMECARQRRLQVAQHRVDPLELGQIARLEATRHQRHVHTLRVSHCRKAAQAIAGRDGYWCQVGPGPFADRIQG